MPSGASQRCVLGRRHSPTVHNIRESIRRIIGIRSESLARCQAKFDLYLRRRNASSTRSASRELGGNRVHQRGREVRWPSHCSVRMGTSWQPRSATTCVEIVEVALPTSAAGAGQWTETASSKAGTEISIEGWTPAASAGRDREAINRQTMVTLRTAARPAKRAFRRSGREDLNLRPPGPQPGALPGCATPRSRASIPLAGVPTTATRRVAMRGCRRGRLAVRGARPRCARRASRLGRSPTSRTSACRSTSARAASEGDLYGLYDGRTASGAIRSACPRPRSRSSESRSSATSVAIPPSCAREVRSPWCTRSRTIFGIDEERLRTLGYG